MILPSLLLALCAHPAQCCLGAQDVDGTTPCVRFQVRGESLNGTGPEAHGPYRFRFTGNLNGGGFFPVAMNFEKEWDTRQHFSMELYVSPTGNGFVIDSGIEEGIALYGPGGERIWHLEAEPKTWLVSELSDNGLILTVKKLEEVERARWTTRSGGWFLPLGMWVGEEYRREPRRDAPWLPVPLAERVFQPDPEREGWLREAIQWNEAKGKADAERVEDLLGAIRRPDDDAADALVALGPSTLYALEDRVETDLDWWFVEERILAKAAQHRWPHRDLDLLLALAAFPEEALREAALERLRTIVPEGVSIAAAAIHTERAKWRWDGEADAYLPH